jgi:hypothetical protein
MGLLQGAAPDFAISRLGLDTTLETRAFRTSRGMTWSYSYKLHFLLSLFYKLP